MQVPEHQKHMHKKKADATLSNGIKQSKMFSWHGKMHQDLPWFLPYPPPTPKFITQLPDESSISENHSNQANYSKTKCKTEEEQFTQHEDQDAEDDAPRQYVILCDHVLQFVQAGHPGHVGVVPGVAEQQCSSEHGRCGV